jgi:hypothetical protein
LWAKIYFEARDNGSELLLNGMEQVEIFASELSVRQGEARAALSMGCGYLINPDSTSDTSSMEYDMSGFSSDEELNEPPRTPM